MTVPPVYTPSTGPGTDSDWLAWGVVGCMGVSLLVLVVLGGLAVVLAVAQPDFLKPPGEKTTFHFQSPWQTDATGYRHAKETAQKRQRPIRLVVYEPWSAVSDSFYTKVLSHPSVKTELDTGLGRRLLPVALNRSAGQAERALGYRWEVTQFPTVLLERPTGEMVVIVGPEQASAMTPEEFLRLVEKAL